ncbi:MAG: transposase, partial [Roseburia sp.]
LYKTCEMNGCSYAIRLKQNSSLVALASDKDEDLYKATKEDQISYAVTYGEFLYQAGSWDYPRRVVFKIEKPYGQLTHMYTFIVTNMDMEPYQVIQFYCGRGKMENFIKEGKGGFDFAAVSSHSKVVNANRMRLHMLAYNLFNWFRRLVLPANMRKQQVDTIRLKLISIIFFLFLSLISIKKRLYESHQILTSQFHSTYQITAVFPIYPRIFRFYF